ncbi:MAG: helix-turn-helix domain-containing protein [Thiohalocapsa sp.]
MNPTLLASAARILWRLLERHGVDPEHVFCEVGLDPNSIHDTRARYADAKTRATWQLAARLIDDPCFGLLSAEVWRPTDFHALGYAFLASRELAVANDAILTDYHLILDHGDVVSRLKTAIFEHLPSGTPSADITAKDVFMSARTLHRRLAEVGTSFLATLEVVRRELAEQYTDDPTRSLSEISFLLGFSEQSAFSRAFRRWTGQAPSAVRDQVA